MSRGEREAWLANVPHVWAEEVLRERGGGLAAEELYRVTLLATGDRKAAELARARRTLDEMRRQSG